MRSLTRLFLEHDLGKLKSYHKLPELLQLNPSQHLFPPTQPLPSTFQKTFVPKLILVLGNLLGVTPWTRILFSQCPGPRFVSLKIVGGLGIRKLEDTNIALLAKLGLAMASNLDVKWVQILKAKYLQKKGFLKAPSSSLSSWLWKGIYKSKALVKKGACFQNMIGSTS